MMLRFDISDFQRVAREVGAFEKQIPFALAASLNEAAKVARIDLIETTWPSHVKLRNKSFLRAALRTQYARKSNLTVAVTESGPAAGRGELSLHAHGGSRQSKRGNIAVPSRDIAERRSGRGVPKNLRPRALPDSFVTDGRRANPHLKQGAVYQRTGAYRAAGTKITATGKQRKKVADFRKVKLRYVLKHSVPIAADVPFEADFARTMKREVHRRFPAAMDRAMKTAFRK